MAYRQPTTIEMPMSQPHPVKPAQPPYGWVIGWVVFGHLVIFAGMTQLQPQPIVPPQPKPIEIRWVELAPPPPPKIVPEPAVPRVSEPVKPKVDAVTPPPPVAKTPAKVMPTVAPVAKPVAKPIVKPVEQTLEAVATPVPVLSTPVQSPAPIVAAPAVAMAQPVVPTTVTTVTVAPAVVANASPRTVAIDGVAYKRQPQVQYPEQARRRGDTGTVLVRALIGNNGRVESATVEQGSGHRLLDQAALRAVNRASFHPYKENGIAQSVYTLIPIAFSLNEE